MSSSSVKVTVKVDDHRVENVPFSATDVVDWLKGEREVGNLLRRSAGNCRR